MTQALDERRAWPLPGFLVAGAPKCGTTSLADALGRHPEVFIPGRKEVAFFHDDEFFSNGMGWYADHFRPAAPGTLIGEATPDYLASARACERIREALPGVKLVFVLRQPTRRAQSHYWFRQRGGREQRSFLEAVRQELDDPEREGNYLLPHGRYGRNLEQYFDRFPAEDIFVLGFSDLTTSPSTELARLGSFLGVDAAALQLPTSNQAAAPRFESLVAFTNWAVRTRSPAKWAANKLMPPHVRHKLRRGLQRLNAKPAATPDLDAEVREVLDGYFAPEGRRAMEVLRAHLGEETAARLTRDLTIDA